MTDKEQNKSKPAENENLPPRRRRNFKKIAVVVLVIMAVGMGTFIYLLRSEPAAIRKQRQFLRNTSKAELREMAVEVDRKIFDVQFMAEYLPGTKLETYSTKAILASIPQDVDPVQKIHLSVNEINALMHTEFENWLDYRGYELPSEVTEPTFALDNDQMVMAFTISAGGFSQVFSADFDIDIKPSGMAVVSVKEFYAGMVPVPAGGLSQYLANVLPDNENIQDAAEWLDKLESIKIKPALKLESKRKALVLDYEVGDDGIDLTIKLVHYGRKTAAKPSLAAVENK